MQPITNGELQEHERGTRRHTSEASDEAGQIIEQGEGKEESKCSCIAEPNQEAARAQGWSGYDESSPYYCYTQEELGRPTRGSSVRGVSEMGHYKFGSSTKRTTAKTKGTTPVPATKTFKNRLCSITRGIPPSKVQQSALAPRSTLRLLRH